MSGKEISFKSLMATEQVAGYLEDLSRGLRAGTVYLRQSGETLELSPAESVEVELEAVEKKGKQKLSLEISWRQVVQAEAQTGGLTISATKPDPVDPMPAAEDSGGSGAGSP